MIDIRRVPDLWRRSDATVRDFPLALLLAVVSLLPALRDDGTRLVDLPARPFDAWTVVVVALECLPLAVRRRWPTAALALVSLGFAADQILAYHTPAGAAMLIATMSAGAHLERHRNVVAILLAGAYLPAAVVITRLDPAEGLEGAVLFSLALVLAWGIGTWLRATRATEAERLRHAEQAARTAERVRIARELHDVVTHHVTAMVVQVEAARYLTTAPDRLDAALDTVGDTGRRAITDLRNLLDVLNPGHGGDERTPPAGDLHTLVEQTRRAGQPVEFTEEGEPAESGGSAELVAFRVVQESLLNALKHARGSRTSVGVRYGATAITVKVSTDGSGSRFARWRGPRARRPYGVGGQGLAGLRERVGVLGGEFSAVQRAGGDFVVQARIPTESPS